MQTTIILNSNQKTKLNQICPHSYSYSNEVGYSSPYGYSPTVNASQSIGYDISADYVDSTTTYEPRSTIIDSDFIGGHSKCTTFYTRVC